MAISPELAAFHAEQADKAAALYVGGMSAENSQSAWNQTRDAARNAVEVTLSATTNLAEIAPAIENSAGHLLVLRRMLAPPKSQDQFKHICPEYNKRNENESRPMAAEAATAVSSAIHHWLDKGLAPWLSDQRQATTQELRTVIDVTGALIGAQADSTHRRNLLSVKQESDVVELLKGLGWTQKSAPLINSLADLSHGQFMHKTRFATRTRPQEVDVACGLGGTVVVAMECKVTNDHTNSVKRINDILKKAAAWQEHWGSFVRTAALLQGVIAYRDVERLLASNVAVFWSHRLEDLDDWLSNNSTT